MRAVPVMYEERCQPLTYELRGAVFASAYGKNILTLPCLIGVLFQINSAQPAPNPSNPDLNILHAWADPVGVA